jgi:Ca2+-binding RTX toxin-like protein
MDKMRDKLSGDGPNDVLPGQHGNDKIGKTRDDRLPGDGPNDVLGKHGADKVGKRLHDDRIPGDGPNDVLPGEHGNDSVKRGDDKLKK